MKRHNPHTQTVIINLRKTPDGYLVDDQKKTDNIKSVKHFKSIWSKNSDNLKEQLHHADSMHKTEY